MKRGVFFSIDALMALGIIFFVIILAYPIIKKDSFGTEIHYDLLETLSALSISEINNAYIQNLLATSQLNASNNSLLEDLGELYISNTPLAKDVASSILSDIETKENIGIWYDTTLLASKNSSPIENAKEIRTSRRLLSGIKSGENITGISARALLSSASQTSYTYFGGYIGQGALTFVTEYNGTISSAQMEIAINTDFDLLINNNLIGHYPASASETTPSQITLPISNFSSGKNKIKIQATNAHVTGGYVKINYDSSLLYSQSKKYLFPGVDGIINIYDGIYIPGTLQNMTIYLHFNSSQSTFLTIGNKTIYNTTGGYVNLSLSNAQLASILNYNELSNSTTPIRLGLENASFIQNGTSNADVVLITDVSGSMDWRLNSDSVGTARNCTDPLLQSPTTKRISLAKCIDKNFISQILSNGNNRIALVSFSSSANNYVDLTSDQVLLNNTIDGYVASGATCVSCAINRAYQILEAQGSPDRPKYIIVMTDGVANVRSTSTCSDIYGSSTNIAQAAGAGGLIVQKQETESWTALPSPTSSQINDLEIIENSGFAVGSSGTIIRFNGSTWTTMSSPVSSTINSIDMLNQTYAIAVGSSGRVLKFTGTSWSTIATISNSPTLHGISIVNSTMMFASGVRSNSGRIYRSLNSGASWTEVYNNGDTLRGIKLENATFGFAVGDNGNIVRFSGSTWSAISSPTGKDLYNIERINSSTWIAVGGDNGNSLIITYSGSWLGAVDTQGDSLRDIIINSSVYAIGEGSTLFSNQAGWAKKFDIAPAYEGTSTTGITCTTDQDSCSEINSYPSLNSNYSSCRAHNDLDATVFSIGFGPITSCNFATQTLQAIASCGNGTFYSSNNATLLQQFYNSIADTIIELSYVEQTATSDGNLTTSLYEDSYIEYSYITKTNPYGLIVTSEQQFDNNGQLNFNVSSGVSILEARVASYSGSKWTKDLLINGFSAYNLSKYNLEYNKLGDPFILSIPLNKINSSNILKLTHGLSNSNETSASSSSKLILTSARNASVYSPIASISQGCIWNIDFEDNTNLTIIIPPSYNGSNTCYYQQATQGYNANDAAQSAVWLLLRSLDSEQNNIVDIRFDSQDVAINLTTIQGIPYPWSTEIQVRVWR